MAKQKQLTDSSHYLTSSISFNKVDLPFQLKQATIMRNWIASTIQHERKSVGSISINFCSDKYLLRMNKEHLQHDYYTDIITFDFCENKTISGDIYISVERVKENAQVLGQPYTIEMKRVIIHGILHLCGYKDKTKQDARLMREKEDYYLSLLG